MPAGLRAAEFFAGMGLMRAALEAVGARVVWANDNAPVKKRLYAAAYGAGELSAVDIRLIHGAELPPVDVATASFPCTDVSLAGGRAGLDGASSGLVWEFLRVLGEMPLRPCFVLLENVAGLRSSRGGGDVADVTAALAKLGYRARVDAVDARWFVPQSRPRTFIRAALGGVPPPLPAVPAARPDLGDIVERLEADNPRWWDDSRVERFIESLAPVHRWRLDALRAGEDNSWRTAFRRTRAGVPTWEIRPDEIAGCLRTARGGSSKQALVQAGGGEARIRLLTARECARLMGAPDAPIGAVTETQAISALGDAVCVPAVAWLLRAWLPA